MAKTPDEQTPNDPVKQRTAKLVRRLGYLVFMGGGLAIFVPMVIAVGQGISSGEVWDPFTGERLVEDDTDAHCRDRARHLMFEAARRDRLESSWDEPYRAWVTRCQETHPELYDLLQTTRIKLKDRATAAPAEG